jgi:predicted kinase
MHHLLHKYNGVEGKHGKYHFKKITVHSAGQRDPDAEGSSGMSGTKMRHHAASGNFKEFRKGVPEHVSDKHAKELMHDTRKGMGIHEDVNRSLFKAIFVTGGPGSGKDIIIREAIADSRAVELNQIQAYDYLADKQKLSEKTSDLRREAIRNRGSLIINGPADDMDRISYIKEELEELGYKTMMVFVNTTNEASQERNTKLSRMMVESVRYDKWMQAQKNKQVFSESFDNFMHIDNTGTLSCIEEDITNTYLNINEFIENKSYSEVALSWLQNHGKLNIGDRIDTLFKEQKNVKSNFKFIQGKTTDISTAARGEIPPDNRGEDPNSGNIKWGGNKRTKDYIFRNYSEENKPRIQKFQPPKESNFSQDKEKIKSKGKRFTDSPTVSQRMRNVASVGPEFDTRQQGTVYPMSGLGDVTYREETDFSKFRNRLKEAIDDPGANDMGVGGTLNGSTNKEPMETYSDKIKNLPAVKKKKQEK